MANYTEQATDHNDELKNFTIISNIVEELDLTPLAFRIYFHYKRFANKPNHEISVKDMMKKYKVGSDAIKKAKQELVDNELITIDESGRSKGIADKIVIVDIVHRNYEYFEAKRVTRQGQTRHYPVTRPVTSRELDPSLDSDALKEKVFKEKEKENLRTQAGESEPKQAKEKSEASSVHLQTTTFSPRRRPMRGTAVNPGADDKLNEWMNNVAQSRGAKNRFTLADADNWETVCIKAIDDDRTLEQFLKVINAERLRLKDAPQFFSPKSVLKQIQLSAPTAKQPENQPKRKTAREYNAEARALELELLGLAI